MLRFNVTAQIDWCKRYWASESLLTRRSLLVVLFVFFASSVSARLIFSLLHSIDFLKKLFALTVSSLENSHILLLKPRHMPKVIIFRTIGSHDLEVFIYGRVNPQIFTLFCWWSRLFWFILRLLSTLVHWIVATVL